MFKSRLLTACLLIITLSIPALAGKTKTAIEKDGVVTDQKLKYTINVPDNWKVKTFKESDDKPEVFRLFLTQKNYQVNMDAKELDGDFTIPEMQFYARPADGTTAQDFFDKLKADVTRHLSDDDIINQLNLLITGEYIDSMHVKLFGEDVIKARYKRVWERHLQADPNDARYRHTGGLIVQTVTDVHEVYMFVHDGYLYVIQDFCEYEFYGQLVEEFANIVASMKFPDATAMGAEPAKTGN
jgi:hypothetical protein